MKGTIHIVDLSILCIVGVLSHEREIPQSILLDVEIDLDLAPAVASQDVADTVDYATVARALTGFIREQRFFLVEALAEGACALVLERWPAVTRCKLTAKKPGALEEARHIAVVVERFAQG